MIGAVVLAAGASTRLGSPKQLAMLGEERLLERAIRVAREAGCSPVVVVLGASAATVRTACDLGDAVVVENENWPEGMGSSIRLGVSALQGVAGCIVMTCDMPAVSAGHLRLLMEKAEVAVSRYAGRNGVPAYFPASVLPELMKLRGDMGARELLKTAHPVELIGGELDVDTVDDLEQARTLF